MNRTYKVEMAHLDIVLVQNRISSWGCSCSEWRDLGLKTSEEKKKKKILVESSSTATAD